MDLTDLLGEREAERPVCSRRGCSAEGLHRIEWNNPKVHSPERRKVWLACDEHRDWLADFLSARGFLKRVAPLGGETR